MSRYHDPQFAFTAIPFVVVGWILAIAFSVHVFARFA